MSTHVIKNPDDEFVRNLKKRIRDNSGFCPCKLDKVKDNKCPCVEFRTTGYCCCGLYIQSPIEDIQEVKS